MILRPCLISRFRNRRQRRNSRLSAAQIVNSRIRRKIYGFVARYGLQPPRQETAKMCNFQFIAKSKWESQSVSHLSPLSLSLSLSILLFWQGGEFSRP